MPRTPGRRLRATILLAALAAGNAGCALSLRDAVVAGVHDSVSAAVSEVLSLISPVSLLTTAMNGGSQEAS
jgi:hypothetical protein